MIDKQVIREILAKQVEKNIHIGDDDSLISTKVIDSLGVAALIVSLEDHYNIVFESDDMTPDNLDSINAIVSFLERKNIS
jgi:acyl carrier protein